MSTSQGTSTGAAKKSENGLDIVNVIQTENEENTVTDVNETESTTTSLRGRKVNTVVVVYRDETETLTEIEPTIGNQTQLATDDIGEILIFLLFSVSFHGMYIQSFLINCTLFIDTMNTVFGLTTV